MRVIQTNVYKFDELSDAAKAKARDWYREASAGDTDFAEFIIRDADEIAALMGIDIGRRSYETIGGRKGYEPRISWSGFSSQGDGASFEGRYTAKPGALERVKAHAPTDEALHAIAARLDAVAAQTTCTITATISTRGNYCHSGSMSIDVECTDPEGESVDIPDYIDLESDLLGALRAFADWIYRALETEYNYQNSDEQVTETIIANEYEFEADGSRARI